MRHAFSTGAGFAGLMLSLFVLLGVLFPAHAAPADAKALQAAHKAYFAGFPTDRTAVLALGQQGNPFASMMLERTWQRPSYGPVSESDARHWRDRAVAADVHSRLQALADANDAIAMTWLGSVYRHGLLGLGEDVPQSAAWYARAAEKGNAVAQWLYAGMLIDGDGVAKDEAAGNAWYLKAAAQGHRLAQAALGYSYEAGRGVAKNPAQALAWYRKAADQGDQDAQVALASAYWNGEGVPRSAVEAVSLFRKPADAGNSTAQYAMGAAYWKGDGVDKDIVQAALWFRKAAAQGHASALNALGILEYQAGNHCAMIDALEAAAPQMGTGTTHRNLAAQYFNLGNLALARDHAQRAIAKGGLDADETASVARILEASAKLEYVDPADLAWSGEPRATRYQVMFDALSDKAFVTSGIVGDYTYSTYNSYLSCGPGKDLLFQSAGGDGSYEIKALYRYDTALGIYRAFPRPWMSGAVGESELTLGPQGQLVSRGVEVDRKGRRRVSELGRSELAVMHDGGVRQSIPAGIFTSKMNHTYATLIPRQGAADAAKLALRDVKAKQAQVQAQAAQEKQGGGGMLRSLVGAAVVGGMASAGGLDGDQVVGAALKGAQIFNPDSAAAAALGATGDQMLGTGGGTAGGLASAASAVSGGGGYATKPNLASGACAGFTEGNYRQKAVSGGGDQQLYAMCGQAFEYYTMYKRAIAQGYSEADANRTYAAHQQSAQVAQGYLQSHGAD